MVRSSPSFADTVYTNTTNPPDVLLQHNQMMPAARSQLMTSDIYHRPVLSMPPVILMGGGGSGVDSMPQSPIVEMPPSPAPSQMPIVTFPDDDIVEVRELKCFTAIL